MRPAKNKHNITKLPITSGGSVRGVAKPIKAGFAEIAVFKIQTKDNTVLLRAMYPLSTLTTCVTMRATLRKNACADNRKVYDDANK